MTDSSKDRIQKDAKGQFAPVQSGGKNDGVMSAKPRVVTGSDDATVHKRPPGVDNPQEDPDVTSDTNKKTDGKRDD